MSNCAKKYEFSLEEITGNDARAIAYSFLKSNTKVLDIGCACGDFGTFINQYDHFDIYGLEYDVDCVEIARKKNVYKKIEQCDLNFFNSKILSEHEKSFDYVCLLDVIEHTLDPEKTIECALTFLNPGGKLIISLPNLAHSSIKAKLLNDDFSYTKTGILDETHIRFFTYKTIVTLMNRLGLQVETMKPKIKIESIRNLDLPRKISRFIFSDQHSYVYQYVFVAKRGCCCEDLLQKHNSGVMNPRVIVSKKEIYKERLVLAVQAIRSLLYRS